MSGKEELSNIAGIGTRWGKSYGDTTLGYGTSAHLGDVSQDVHVHGDLHVNINGNLDGLATAAIITNAIFCGSRILSLASEFARELIMPVSSRNRLDGKPVHTVGDSQTSSKPERTPEAISSRMLKDLRAAMAQMRFHVSFFGHGTHTKKSERVGISTMAGS